MIKIENVETAGWEPAIRGMRNPLNSWDKSDSCWCAENDSCCSCPSWDKAKLDCSLGIHDEGAFAIGPNDHDLMMRLRNAGTDHRKFMRMIVCYCDITAPLYWWKEFDTYRQGVEKNSCSTMHKIADHEFTRKDFSCEYLIPSCMKEFEDIIKKLNDMRLEYLNWDRTHFRIENDSQIVDRSVIWNNMIQILPSSYNQRRTVMMSYEALANMYHARKNHKLDEWKEFCEWAETLPYSELITGGGKNA